MFSEDQIKIFKALECVAHKTHECSKQMEPDSKCSICDLGFIYIAEQPLELSCGHCVCISCTDNHQKTKFKCETHFDTEVNAASHMARLFIRNSLNILYPFLSQKYESMITLCQSAKAQFEYTIEEGAQMIKDQIDKRVKVRKEELDSIREKMHKQVDSYTEQLKIKLNFESDLAKGKEDCIQLSDFISNKKQATEDEYFKLQNALVKLMRETQDLLNIKLKLKFTDSNKEVNQDDIIGILVSNDDQTNSESTLTDNIFVQVKKEIEPSEENKNPLPGKIELIQNSANSPSNIQSKVSMPINQNIHSKENVEMNKNENSNETSFSTISSDSFFEIQSDHDKSHHESPMSNNNKKRRSDSPEDWVSDDHDDKQLNNKKQRKETTLYNLIKTYKHNDFVQDIKYIGDGRMVSCSKGKVRLWDIKKGKMLEEANFDAFRLFVTSKKTIIAVGNNHCNVLWWDPEKRVEKILKTKGVVRSVEQLSSGAVVFGERIISGPGFVNNLTFWEVNNFILEYVNMIENAHDDTIQYLKELPGNYFASSSKDNSIKIWRKDSKDRYVYIRSLTGHSMSVSNLECIDNKYLMSSSYDKTARLWDYENGVCISVIETKKPYHQIINFENVFACRGNLQSTFFDIYDKKDFKLIKEYSIKHLNPKRQPELAVQFENHYLACSFDCDFFLFDIQNDLSKINNEI